MTVDLTKLKTLRTIREFAICLISLIVSILPASSFKFFGSNLLSLFLVSLSLYYFYDWLEMKIRGRGRPLPPGPNGVPVMGFLPFLGRQFHLTLTNLGKRFGPVYQVFLGGKRVVVLSDPKLVRQAFRQVAFSGRPDTELTKVLQGYGIINSEGDLWKEQRAFLHSVLREFGAKNSQGAGKAALEQKIQTQVHLFLADIADYEGGRLQVRPHLARAVSNVVSSWLMSVTYSEEDKRFSRLLELIDEGFRLLTLAVPVNFIPVLRFLPGMGGGAAYRKICSNKEETEEYFREIADEHRKTLDPENVRDFVDVYLLQLEKRKAVDAHDPKVTYFSEKQLIQVLCDIYSAGLETVTSTLEWAILFLLVNQDVQSKIQVEIDSVIGRERLPELKDMPYLPYTEATILEVLRRANVIVLGNAHATVEDAELGGFFIPKDTHVLPNLWAIHMDSELWSNPEEFNPDRFINAEGKIQKPDYFMPFSVGRRMCLGDVLTKMEIFLFLAGLLHQFNLRLPEGESIPSTDGRVAVSLTPDPFSVTFEPREGIKNRPLISRCL